MQPFFSVLVPVYNAIKYLGACMESLMTQNFQDFEILLLDDSSTDGSSALCDNYQQSFPDKVRVIHQPNQGITVTRAALFREARGQYIINVDSDDLLRPQAMETIRDYIIRYSADVVIYRASRSADYSVPLRELPFADGQVVSLADSELLRKLMLTGTLMCNLWNKAFRRELAQLDWDFEKLSHVSEGEDLMFSVGILDGARRVVFSDKILYYYRPNPESITSNYKPGLYRSLRDATVLQRRYAQKWDSTGTLARECDQDALQRYYKILARIALSGNSLAQRRKEMREIAKDPEFQRICPLIDTLSSRKERWILTLVKMRCFWPLNFYTWLKRTLNK